MAKVCWFTGMSGSGKSTIGEALKQKLEALNKKVILLDGDNIRNEHQTKLGFTQEDIINNNLRVIARVESIMSDYQVILVAMISPFESTRTEARKRLQPDYVEIFVQTSLETLISRDVKGLYKRALNGEIENFIGLDDRVPYEAPAHPDLLISTEEMGVQESVEMILDKLAL